MYIVCKRLLTRRLEYRRLESVDWLMRSPAPGSKPTALQRYLPTHARWLFFSGLGRYKYFVPPMKWLYEKLPARVVLLEFTQTNFTKKHQIIFHTPMQMSAVQYYQSSIFSTFYDISSFTTLINFLSQAIII